MLVLVLLGEDGSYKLISNHADAMGHSFKMGECDGCPADCIVNKMGYLPFLFISVVFSCCIHNTTRWTILSFIFLV